MDSPDEITRELECGAMLGVKEGLVKEARGSRGKTRSEESLRKHCVE